MYDELIQKHGAEMGMLAIKIHDMHKELAEKEKQFTELRGVLSTLEFLKEQEKNKQLK